MSHEDSTPDGGRRSDSNVFDRLPEPSSRPVPRSQRYRQLFDEYVMAPLRIAWDDWRARFGIVTLVAFVLMGTLGVILVDQPSINDGPVYTQPFSSEHMTTLVETPDVAVGGFTFTGIHFWAFPLGTDGYGQDLVEMIVHATPAMLKMVIAGAVFSIGVATVIGITAGFKGGRVDRFLMFLTDIVLTLPGLPLVILIASVYPPRDPFVVGIILAIDNWPGLARGLRSQVLAIREESYVEAARAQGLSTSTILGKDIAPQLMPYILINAAGAARGIIFESVALYFLGILPFTVFNWGVMMNFAYSDGAMVSPLRRHYLFIPMIVIVLLSLGLILLSQGMDRIVNPRLRARHMKTGSDEDDGEIREMGDVTGGNV